MDHTPIFQIISMTIYKLLSLGIGFALCYLGYKLFIVGVWGPRQGEVSNAGEVHAEFGDNRLLIKSAAPGTFFVVLGAIVLFFVIMKGLNVNYKGEIITGGGLSEINDSNEYNSNNNKEPEKLPNNLLLKGN